MLHFLINVAKPGKCPPVQATCPSPGGEVPQKYIPCGDSAKKPGRTAKENDWDCPGETKSVTTSAPMQLYYLFHNTLKKSSLGVTRVITAEG